MAKAPKAPKAKTAGRAKLIVFWTIIVIAPFLLAEILLRVYFATTVGPDLLLYGFVPSRQDVLLPKEDLDHTVTAHLNKQAGYTKYFPNQTRVDHDKDTGEVFNVRINSRGFRGKDFDPSKAEGVLRVVTLGASSTFGYNARDNETYPVYLERLLEERCGGPGSVEVINLGVPHLTSGQILSLFLAEAVPLKPDVITFYEGVNDTDWPLPTVNEMVSSGHIVRVPYHFLRRHILLVNFLHNLRMQYMAPVFSGTSKDKLETIAAAAEKRAARFRTNVAAIRDRAERLGAKFIVANQMAKSLLVDREKIRGLTYAKEVQMVREALASRKYLQKRERQLLYHARLMREVADWAKSADVPMVDVLEALDQRRDVLVSWVHLTAEGNRLVAGALADEIERQACGSKAAKSRPAKQG